VSHNPDTHEFRAVIKADVMGTVEAVQQALEKLKNSEIQFSTRFAGVGGVTESDVDFAHAAKGSR